MYQKEIIYMGLHKDGSRLGSAGFLKVESRDTESTLYLKVKNIPHSINGRFPVRFYNGVNWKEVDGITLQEGNGLWEECEPENLRQVRLQIILPSGYLIEGMSKEALQKFHGGGRSAETAAGTGMTEKEAVSNRAGTAKREAVWDRASIIEEETVSARETMSNRAGTIERDAMSGRAAASARETVSNRASTVERETMSGRASTVERETVSDRAVAEAREEMSNRASTGARETVLHEADIIEEEAASGRAAAGTSETVSNRASTEARETVSNKADTIEREAVWDRASIIEEEVASARETMSNRAGKIKRDAMSGRAVTEAREEMSNRVSTEARETVSHEADPAERETASPEKNIGARQTRTEPVRTVEHIPVQRQRSIAKGKISESSAMISEELPPPMADQMQMNGVKEDKWEQILDTYDQIHPYGDERVYVKLEPKDFVILQAKYQYLVNNSFLLHGFYNYRYVILGKENDYYLGVPGVFYEREKMVALMFGFEAFECQSGEAKPGEFGYYLRKVEL